MSEGKEVRKKGMSEVREIIRKKDIDLPPLLTRKIERYLKEGIIKKKYLEQVIDQVAKEYDLAKVEPGEGVGVLAAQSIGEPGTQMMMRTKHYAGTAMDVTRGLPRLIEIFDARRTPKTPMMTIYLEQDLNNLEKAEKLAHSIKETRLKDVAKNTEVNFLKYEVIIELDKHELTKRGITPKKLEEIIKAKFAERAKVHDEKLVFRAPKKTAASMQKLKEEVQATHLSGVKGVSYVVIQKEGKDYVLYTKGTNLKMVFDFKGIDKKRTKSNDIMEIENIFGIEAARNALVYETLETLKEAGLKVDPRHVTLVADTMCVDGIIKAIGRHGVSGDKASVLARASFEETVKHLLKAGAYGEEDRLKGVVENIIVGQVIALGTGIPELIIKGQAGKAGK